MRTTAARWHDLNSSSRVLDKERVSLTDMIETMSVVESVKWLNQSTEYK